MLGDVCTAARTFESGLTVSQRIKKEEKKIEISNIWLSYTTAAEHKIKGLIYDYR